MKSFSIPNYWKKSTFRDIRLFTLSALKVSSFTVIPVIPFTKDDFTLNMSNRKIIKIPHCAAAPILSCHIFGHNTLWDRYKDLTCLAPPTKHWKSLETTGCLMLSALKTGETPGPSIARLSWWLPSLTLRWLSRQIWRLRGKQFLARRVQKNYYDGHRDMDQNSNNDVFRWWPKKLCGSSSDKV